MTISRRECTRPGGARAPLAALRDLPGTRFAYVFDSCAQTRRPMTNESQDVVAQAVDACQRCADLCVCVAMNQDVGDDAARTAAYRLVSDCAEFCDSTTKLFLSRSPIYPVVAAACAAIC